jgi:DNA-binding XRE family transcriptional regulator
VFKKSNSPSPRGGLAGQKARIGDTALFPCILNWIAEFGPSVAQFPTEEHLHIKSEYYGLWCHLVNAFTAGRVLRNAIANTLKFLRSERGLSQEELGFEANLHRTFISQLERGLKSPTVDSLYAICRVLDITPSEFLSPVDARLKGKRR